MIVYVEFSVSYWAWDYYAYRKDAPLPDSFNDADEMVKWKLEPPPLVAMQDFARWEEAEVGLPLVPSHAVADSFLWLALGRLERAMIFLPMHIYPLSICYLSTY